MKNLRYYIRTYDNMDVRMIDLNKADLNAKQIKFIALDQPQSVRDLTP
jgi:penicillin V acylase-like amidase (Ntn superfamily)